MKYWMKLGFVLVFAATTPLVLAGKGDAKKGKEIYMSRCAQCHGQNGEGKPQIEKMFNVKMKALASKEVQDKTDEVLMKDIQKGNGKMPPVNLSNAEAEDVVAYLRTLPKEKKDKND